MAASQASTNAMNDRALDAAIKTTPGAGTALFVGEKATDLGLDAGKEALDFGKGAVSASLMSLGTGLAALKQATPLPPGHSNSVPLLSFLARCEKEKHLANERYENHLDFSKKYDEPAGIASIDLGETRMSWAMVFELEKRVPQEKEEGDAEDEEDEEDAGAMPEPDESGLLVPRECIDLCQRLWAVDVEVHCQVALDGGEIYITVGLTYEMMIDEAEVTGVRMRLNNAMGCSPFEHSKLHHYAPNLFDEHPEKATVFTSAHRQRLTWSRMARLGGINLEDSLHYIDRDSSMAILVHHLEHNHHVRAKLVKEVLTACGAFRPHAGDILGEKVKTLAAQVISEPFFTVEPTHVLTAKEQAVKYAQDEALKRKGQEPVTWESLKAAIEDIRAWTAKEPGKSEQYVGTLLSFFPLHCEIELEYLRDQWGDFSLICRPWIQGKQAEGEGTPCYCESPMEVRHFSMTWIPLDSIRDYYGDHVGIYFAWLQLYTKSMIMPSLFGILTFLAPLSRGKTPGTEPDENPLVAPYSIYLCIWTATFLSLWTRRENELKFLWGSEHYEDEQETRRQFVGVMEINKVTKKVKLKHKSAAQYGCKLSCSYTFSMVLICVVITGAFSASMLRFYQAPPLCMDLGLQPGEQGYIMARNHPDEMSCARCESPVLTDSDLHDEMLVPDYNTHNYTMVQYERAHYGPSFCEETCVPGEVLEGGIELPPSPGCFINANGTNVWNDGYPSVTSAWEKSRWKYSSAAANTMLIVIFGNIYEKVAVSLNKWENHRTKTEYEDNLILKNFVFQFVNNYFVLFYIAYMRQVDLSFIHKDLGEIDAECKGGSCLPELSVQVGVVFTTKMLIAQILEVVKPWLIKHKATVVQGLHLNALKKQIEKAAAETAQIVLPDSIEEMVHVDEATLQRKEALDSKHENLERRLHLARERVMEEGTDVEKESYLVEYESTFDDFNEMAIQYGYLALFSPAYPLAPLLALINNIVEIRVDAMKLCHAFRRPKWEPCEDIGSWMSVLSSIGFAAVMVNSTMVAFVGSKHSVLGDRGLPDTTHDDEEALLAEEMGGFKARIQNSNLWLYAVGIEHAMLLLRIMVITVFPDEPVWLDEAREVLAYRLDDMKDKESLESEMAVHNEFLDKMDEYDGEDHAPLEHLTTRSIRAHMEERKKGGGKDKAKEKKEQKKTAVKVNNPLQQAFDNPMLGQGDSDSDSDSDGDEQKEQGLD